MILDGHRKSVRREWAEVGVLVVLFLGLLLLIGGWVVKPLVLDLPIRLQSELNRHEHWSKTSGRRKTQRQTVALVFKLLRPSFLPDTQFHVELTRFCPRVNWIRDSDNLPAAFKAIRDEVAAQLGVDDADLKEGARTSWAYHQDASPDHSVRVVIHGRLPGETA